jgi:hypothetical protein
MCHRIRRISIAPGTGNLIISGSDGHRGHEVACDGLGGLPAKQGSMLAGSSSGGNFMEVVRSRLRLIFRGARHTEGR